MEHKEKIMSNVRYHLCRHYTERECPCLSRVLEFEGGG
jgi:hypothetical protein